MKFAGAGGNGQNDALPYFEEEKVGKPVSSSREMEVGRSECEVEGE